MRYIPERDCMEYYEWLNPWEMKPWFSAGPPKKVKKPKVLRQWEEEDNTGKQVTIPYWRDIEKHNEVIKDKDLKFEKWPRHRRKPCEETLLPPHMCHGLRFIKVTMGYPLAWRYGDFPISLNEVRTILKAEAAEAKRLAAEKRKAAKEAKKAKKGAKDAKKEGDPKTKKEGDPKAKKEANPKAESKKDKKKK